MSAHLDQHATAYNPFPSISALTRETQIVRMVRQITADNRTRTDAIDACIRAITTGPVPAFSMTPGYDHRDILDTLHDLRSQFSFMTHAEAVDYATARVDDGMELPL